MSMKGYRAMMILALFLFMGIDASQTRKASGEIVQERMLPAVAAIVTRLVTALGPRVYIFTTCMGAAFTLECGQKMIDCATRGNAPWECIGGITCSGKSALQCARTTG